jgi:hypothetical protein
MQTSVENHSHGTSGLFSRKTTMEVQTTDTELRTAASSGSMVGSMPPNSEKWVTGAPPSPWITGDVIKTSEGSMPWGTHT